MEGGWARLQPVEKSKWVGAEEGQGVKEPGTRDGLHSLPLRWEREGGGTGDEGLSVNYTQEFP